MRQSFSDLADASRIRFVCQPQQQGYHEKAAQRKDANHLLERSKLQHESPIKK